MFPSKWMFVCLFTCFHSCSVSEASKEALDVKHGDDVILQCHSPKDAAMLRWTKPDMSSEEYVFFLREKRFYEDFQHPQFHGRVELVNPDVKNGNFSVILKNVTIDDAGLYECHVGKSQSRRRKRETPQLISRVILNVDSPWKDMEAQTGDPVTLPCQGPSSIPITSVKWTVRNKKDHVFFYHDGRTVSENQDPAYKNWVELKDSDLKNGDASLILKDVMNVESGAYECWINERKTSIVDLYVYPRGGGAGHTEGGGDKDGRVGLIVVWKDMEAQTGDNVTLPCQGPSSIPITSVNWTVRNKTGYVFFYHDGQAVPDAQGPVYKNWVELNDSEMKDGDASLILKDVMNVDSGTYECWINERKTSIINLYVSPQGGGAGHTEDGGDKDGGDKDGRVGLIVGLSVIVLLVVVFVVFLRKSFFPHVQKPVTPPANNENFRLM